MIIIRKLLHSIFNIRNYVHPKPQELSELHSATTQKTVIFANEFFSQDAIHPATNYLVIRTHVNMNSQKLGITVPPNKKKEEIRGGRKKKRNKRSKRRKWQLQKL
jgi:hypothetical protein